MQAALIGGIHANLPALEAVLAHIRSQDISKIWNVGDSVGLGVFPNEVVHRLRKEDVLSIVGDGDLQILLFKQKKDKWRRKKSPEDYLNLKWTYEHLSKKNRKYLRFLSQEVRLKAKDRSILLTHGSPASNEEGLGPNTSRKRLRELAQMAQADVIVCGHSRQAFVRELDGAWFINPGSLGRSSNEDPRACYAVLQIDSTEIQVFHHRVEYDVEQVSTAVHRQNLPQALAELILTGYDLSAG